MAKKDSHTNSLSEKQLRELRQKNPDIIIPDKDLKIDGFNSELEKFLPQGPTLKEIKKELGIKDEDIARMFGYDNAVSYRNAKRKKKIDNGIIELYQLIRRVRG